VWAEVQGIGKFAEQGRPYFDRTWRKAEEKTRLKIYERQVRRSAPPYSRNDISKPSTMIAHCPISPGEDDLPPPHGVTTKATTIRITFTCPRNSTIRMLSPAPGLYYGAAARSQAIAWPSIASSFGTGARAVGCLSLITNSTPVSLISSAVNWKKP
jgi:hypothetical protein